MGHSNIIAYLLSPFAEHKHKDIFLKLFLERVCSLNNYTFQDLLHIDLSTTEVFREYSKIDIYLKHEQFSIILENKIFACDQESQLFRYKEAIKKSVSLEKIYVIYLSLNGNEPDEISTCKDKELEELKK